MFLILKTKIRSWLLRNGTEILKMLLQRIYSLAVFKKKAFIIIEYVQNKYLKHCSVNWFQWTDPSGIGILSLASVIWCWVDPVLWRAWTIWIPDSPKHFPITHPCPYHLPSCPSSLFDSYSFFQSFLQCSILDSRPISISQLQLGASNFDSAVAYNWYLMSVFNTRPQGPWSQRWVLTSLCPTWYLALHLTVKALKKCLLKLHSKAPSDKMF